MFGLITCTHSHLKNHEKYCPYCAQRWCVRHTKTRKGECRNSDELCQGTNKGDDLSIVYAKECEKGDKTCRIGMLNGRIDY